MDLTLEGLFDADGTPRVAASAARKRARTAAGEGLDEVGREIAGAQQATNAFQEVGMPSACASSKRSLFSNRHMLRMAYGLKRGSLTKSNGTRHAPRKQRVGPVRILSVW